MRFYFKNGKNAAQAFRKICDKYGVNVIKEHVSRKWFTKFMDH